MSDETDYGYELNDPKHPTYYERFANYADYTRKQVKENNDGELDESDEPDNLAESVS